MMFSDTKQKIEILKGTIGALPLEHRDVRYLVKQIDSIENSILGFIRSATSGIVQTSTQARIIEKAERLLKGESCESQKPETI